MRSEWNSVLGKSNANKLFMNWDWQFNWWREWGADHELYLYKITKNEQLIGILPLYRLNNNAAIFKQYHFLGNAWNVFPSVRSEYISPIFDSAYEMMLTDVFYAFVKRHSVNSIFVLPDSQWIDRIRNFFVVRRMDKGYRLPLCNNFSAYLGCLSRSTRLKVFNRRKNLEAGYPSMTIEFLNQSHSTADFFGQLNAFHVRRWGAPCFDERATSFHKRILQSDGLVPLLSSISINNEVVSVSYNIIMDDVLYNLQSGYLESFDKKISLGTIHMGYVIEYAHSITGLKYFDFLAGRGKSEDYKKHFKGEEVSFTTVQIFSHPVVGFFYQLFVGLKNLFKLLLDKIDRGDR